jgi:hypothetical protein
MKGSLSFLRNNRLRLLSAVLLVAVVTLGVGLSVVSQSYYYERNMHKYAVGVEFLAVRDSFDLFALDADLNRSALSGDIVAEWNALSSALVHLTYMDPINVGVWNDVLFVSEQLRVLAEEPFFSNGSSIYPRLSPEQVCPHILQLNVSISEAYVDIEFTDSEDASIYSPDGNVFMLDEAKMQDAARTSQQLTHYFLNNGMLERYPPALW